jgi:hypothetical protein
VEDAVAPGVEESVVDLNGGEHRVVKGEGAGADEEVVEVFAADVGHQEIVETIAFADVEDGGDVGVSGETGAEEAFAAEAVKELGLAGERGMQDLDGEQTIVDAVADEVDAGHAADTDKAEYKVFASEQDGEPGADVLGVEGNLKRGRDGHERRRRRVSAGMVHASAWIGTNGMDMRGSCRWMLGCRYQ